MKLDYSPAVPAPRRTARRTLVIATTCAVILTAIATREGVANRKSMAPPGLPPELTTVLDEANGNEFSEEVQAALADPLEVPPASEWQTVTVTRGQTLSDIFEQNGLGFSEAMAVVRLGKDAARLKSLRTGDKLLIKKTPDDKLEELSFELDETSTLNVRRNAEDGFDGTIVAAEIERRPTQVSAVVENSLFLDGQRAGLSSRLLMDMAQMFGYDIDFALDLRRGDRFAVVYDVLYKNGEKLRDGDIVAAEFVNRGKSFRAVRYTDADGKVAYYTPEGESLRKAFMRTPVDFVRISSGFNLKRRHPILNTIRAHKGVDYAAATGTPIKATGDGTVEFIGNKSGYGRVIILKHGSQYTTLYAHMSRYREGLKVGARVRQGQVIGYVGATGLATAPHLHYEFRSNGVHKNPLSVLLPRSNPLSKAQLAAWRVETASVLAQLDTLGQAQVAQAQAATAAADANDNDEGTVGASP
ncbi:MAG TPA: peptidoglycan DD-metalloendopeptidase family protein [Fontimonas sp.]